ncbi:MAG: hypothetical protein J0L82_14390 [Deltaproteobacteria bacterium]|nr:hypothetical protein [Deltaproteobacteria bacterium]
MKKFLVLFVLVLLPSVSNAADSSYRNFNGKTSQTLYSEQGLEIKVEASRYSSGYAGATQVDTAEELSVTVSGRNLKEDSTVVVALMPRCRSIYYGESKMQADEAWELSRKADGSRQLYMYSKKGVTTFSAIHGGDQVVCTIELSVSVDGKWQTDRESMTLNFALQWR